MPNSYRLENLLKKAQSLINALEAEELGNKKEFLGDRLGDKRVSSLEASAPNNMSKPEPIEPMNKSFIYPESPPTLNEGIYRRFQVTQDSE